MVAIGDKVTTVKVGDVVAYPAYVGLEMTVLDAKGKEEKLLLMELKNVAAIYKHGIPVTGGFEMEDEGVRLFSNEDL